MLLFLLLLLNTSCQERSQRIKLICLLFDSVIQQQQLTKTRKSYSLQYITVVYICKDIILIIYTYSIKLEQQQKMFAVQNCLLVIIETINWCIT